MTGYPSEPQSRTGPIFPGNHEILHKHDWSPVRFASVANVNKQSNNRLATRRGKALPSTLKCAAHSPRTNPNRQAAMLVAQRDVVLDRYRHRLISILPGQGRPPQYSENRHMMTTSYTNQPGKAPHVELSAPAFASRAQRSAKRERRFNTTLGQRRAVVPSHSKPLQTRGGAPEHPHQPSECLVERPRRQGCQNACDLRSWRQFPPVSRPPKHFPNPLQ